MSDLILDDKPGTSIVLNISISLSLVRRTSTSLQDFNILAATVWPAILKLDVSCKVHGDCNTNQVLYQ